MGLNCIRGGDSKSIDDGIGLLRKAYGRSGAEAALALGQMYLTGTYLPKDEVKAKECYGKALEWYTKASSLGRTYADRQISLMYEKVIGVEQSDQLAREWMDKADSKGRSREQECLDRLLGTWEGIEFHENGTIDRKCRFLTDEARCEIDVFQIIGEKHLLGE